MPVLSLPKGLPFDEGSGQAMIFKAPPQLGQRSTSISKTRLSSLAQLRRAGALCA
jgi:hypothetical protein